MHLVHVRVAAAEGHEFVVGAALDDAAAFEEVDAVGGAHRAEAVAAAERSGKASTGQKVLHQPRPPAVSSPRGMSQMTMVAMFVVLKYTKPRKSPVSALRKRRFVHQGTASSTGADHGEYPVSPSARTR